MLYTAWCILVFALTFLLVVPFVLLGSWLASNKSEAGLRLAHGAIRTWGHIAFPLIGMPLRVEWRFRPQRGQAYVYCANHFSYLDIAVLGVIIPGLYAFIGKIGVRKIPLFGYMFAKLHVMVDRSSAESRAYSLTKCIRTLASGRPIIIFPEGGIKAPLKPDGSPPTMIYPFKDGAFTMAIQQQVPVVPVTLLNNYRIVPDASPFRVHWAPSRIVIHEPIPTTGLTQTDASALRERTYRTIEEELVTDDQ
jgi:1-acyl-sn-glycerol-3-phosphate acyltransferase